VEHDDAMDMKRDYYEDIQLFKSRVVLFWSAAFLLFLFTLPLYLPQYHFYLLNLILVHVILAVGLNILVGYTGQISLGHAGFFAIGAYGTALLILNLQLPFLLALPCPSPRLVSAWRPSKLSAILTFSAVAPESRRRRSISASRRRGSV
jgi:ABC-type branched-subunit amino acid transport system permease subunit